MTNSVNVGPETDFYGCLCHLIYAQRLTLPEFRELCHRLVLFPHQPRDTRTRSCIIHTYFEQTEFMFSLQNKSTGAKFHLSLTENTFFNMGPDMGTLHLGCSAPPPSFCSTKCLILCYTIVPMIFNTNKQTKKLGKKSSQIRCLPLVLIRSI